MKLCGDGLRGIPEIMGGIETHYKQQYTEPRNEIEVSVIVVHSPHIKNSFKCKKNVSVIPVFTIRSKILETFLHTLICIFYTRLIIKPDALRIHGIGPCMLTALAIYDLATLFVLRSYRRLTNICLARNTKFLLGVQ